MSESEAWHAIGGDGRPSGGILIVADHASAYVPADIYLGVAPDVLDRHVAVDIGVAPLVEALCERIGCTAILGGVSRLVCDLNRDEDAPGLVPVESDDVVVTGNASLDAAERAARVARFFHPYHAALAERIAHLAPAMLVSLHSFTPCLASRPDEERPWQVGILYNRDERAARIAIPMLERAGIATGENQPYSGQVLNATMNRHGEANGIPYLGIEVRQDLIGDAAGVAAWAAKLGPVIVATRDAIVQTRHDAGAAMP